MLFDMSLELYLVVVGALFLLMGLWLGGRMKFRPRVLTPEGQVFEVNRKQIQSIGISKRELEVLTLVAQGLSNQEIAEELFISISTVKTHTSNIYSKLGAKNRAGAIVEARNHGLVA